MPVLVLAPRAVPPADLHIPVLGQLALAKLARGNALEAGPLEVIGFHTLRGRRLRQEISTTERPQPFLPSKPATGTAVEISEPSIRNTRPCDVHRRTFNTS